ncbi:MAG: DUF6428 family protein [Paracoccaceae bacterium]|nr:DUF6428 family protein [Paracoccaceae bacterium]
MNLQDLVTNLKGMPADADLIFSLGNQEIEKGYHLTEFKLANITSVDCGGRFSAWHEATMQLLDGSGGEYMKVGTFVAIAEKSERIVDNLSSAKLGVEFAIGNAGIQIFDLEGPLHEGHAVKLGLNARSAACKPSSDLALAQANAGSTQASNSTCCAPAKTSCC